MVRAFRAALALPHLVGDDQRLLEHLEALAEGREREAERARLLLVPRGADAEDRAPAGDHIERRRLLREERGVAIRDPGHQRPKSDATGLTRECGEGHPALEHRFRDRPHARDLVQVVHHRDQAETGLLGGACLLDDASEQSIGWDLGVGVAGKVVAEPNAHAGSLLRRRFPWRRAGSRHPR